MKQWTFKLHEQIGSASTLDDCIRVETQSDLSSMNSEKQTRVINCINTTWEIFTWDGGQERNTKVVQPLN